MFYINGGISHAPWYADMTRSSTMTATMAGGDEDEDNNALKNKHKSPRQQYWSVVASVSKQLQTVGAKAHSAYFFWRHQRQSVHTERRPQPTQRS